jgi:hypothetical protein
MEGKHVATRSRVIQDRRAASRVETNLGCQVTFKGVSHDAVILNLSLTSALLSSLFLPPKGADVTITVQTPLLKNTLILEGKVIREDLGIPDYRRGNRFAIQFSHAPSEIIKLISKLTS